jgi:NADH:ubiquinone oxidoreductase subunit B-like Fe-S oxidoreductase
LRVRITKKPVPTQVEPFDVSRFEIGKVYEVGSRLAEVLIVAGYAEPEMRSKNRVAVKPAKPSG